MQHVWECDLTLLRDTFIRAPLRGMEPARLNLLRAHIRERGFLSAMYRGVPPPDWIGGGDAVSAGEHKTPVDDASGMLRRTLPGIGCSPGRATGIARVIRTLDESHSVKKVRSATGPAALQYGASSCWIAINRVMFSLPITPIRHGHHYSHWLWLWCWKKAVRYTSYLSFAH